MKYIPLPPLKLLTDYLANRKEQTKLETSCSSCETIEDGFSQRSILSPLLDNILFFLLYFIYIWTTSFPDLSKSR